MTDSSWRMTCTISGSVPKRISALFCPIRRLAPPASITPVTGVAIVSIIVHTIRKIYVPDKAEAHSLYPLQGALMKLVLCLSTPVKSDIYDTPIISFQRSGVNKKQGANQRVDISLLLCICFYPLLQIINLGFI